MSTELDDRGADEERRLDALTSAAIFTGGGSIAILAVAGLTWRWPINGYRPGVLALTGFATAVGAVATFLLRGRISWRTFNFWLIVSTILTSAVQIVGSAAPSFGPIVLLWIIILAFAYLPRRAAFAQSMFALTAICVIFAVQPGWQNPVAYAIFLGLTIVLTVYIMVRLLQRAESHAERERAVSAELAELNRTLEHRVDEQVDELERMARLRRFLSPSVADAVLTAEGDDWLTPHRAEIAAAFIDLRGFTTFSGVAEPEDVTELLHAFHEIVGELVVRYEATVGAFAGDGVLLYFNDPVPCPDPAGSAVRLAVDLRAPMDSLAATWTKRGFDVGYGVGIAYGFATLGITGFDSRRDYTAIGTVINLASRLSDEAGRGEVLLEQRAWSAVQDEIATHPIGEIELKGFSRPIPVYAVGAEV